MRQSEQRVMAACRAAFVGGPFSMKEVSTEAIPHARIQQWCLGTKSPRAWEVSDLLVVMSAQNPAAAMEWATACLGLRRVGLEVVRSPAAEPGDALVVDGLQLAAAAGILSGEIARAAADGRVTPEEEVAISNATIPVVREALEIRAQVHAAQRTQTCLAGAL